MDSFTCPAKFRYANNSQLKKTEPIKEFEDRKELWAAQGWNYFTLKWYFLRHHFEDYNNAFEIPSGYMMPDEPGNFSKILKRYEEMKP